VWQTRSLRENRGGFIESSIRGRKCSGFWIQVIVQIEAFKEAFAYIIGQVRHFDGSMYEIDRPLGGIQNNTTIVTPGKVFFDFLAKFGGKLAIDIFG
jgi:hypothetical protein